jgi:hypothetical protein
MTPKPQVREEVYTEKHITGVDDEEFVRALKAGKKTGAVTIHLGNGKVGSLVWKSKDAPAH